MNLGTMRSALQRRGFADADTDDIDQAINDACVELDSLFLWPYREKSVTGSPAPLLIPDLGLVDEVLDLDSGSVPLERVSWDELAAAVGDTSVTGTPQYWYTAAPEGVLQVATYPVSDHELGVQYWALTETLALDADVPLAPAAWHGVIVDIAQASLYPDGETPPGLAARIERRIGVMVGSLMAEYGPTEMVGDGVDS